MLRPHYGGVVTHFSGEVVEFWLIHVVSLLPGGHLRRTIDDMRELLTEVRVARPAVHSDEN